MKKGALLFLFLFCIAMPRAYSKFCYGMSLENKMVTSDKQSYINGMPIHCYEINGEVYIIAEDLAKYGFGLYFSEGIRTFSIVWYDFYKVYVTKELEDRGQQCFDLHESDIVTLINNEPIPSYNIGGQTAIQIKSLECYGNVIYSDDGNTIYFESTPAWSIAFPEDHNGDTSQELLHFKLEMVKNPQGEWIVTGENRQYLYAIVAYWEKPSKTSIQICIPKTLLPQSKKLLSLFENNSDLNSKQKSTPEDIALANVHTTIYVNGEKANIVNVKYESEDSPNCAFWLYLDKDLVSANDLQSLTIECDCENIINP